MDSDCVRSWELSRRSRREQGWAAYLVALLFPAACLSCGGGANDGKSVGETSNDVANDGGDPDDASDGNRDADFDGTSETDSDGDADDSLGDGADDTDDAQDEVGDGADGGVDDANEMAEEETAGDATDSRDPGDSGDVTDEETADDGCLPVAGDPVWDSFGGDGRVSLEATGFFRVEKFCGRWWFVTPEGHPFWSAGVNSISPTGPTGQDSGIAPYGVAVDAKYPDDAAWADATSARLREWGFNTAGAWSNNDLLEPRMPTTPVLYLSQADWLSGTVPDYFSDDWATEVDRRAGAVDRWR